MALTTAALNKALDGLAAAIDHLSLHTADPGTTGTSELAGGSPAYARKVPTFVNPTVNADLTLSATVTFDVPAGNTVTHVGLWNGSTFLGSNALAQAESFGVQGQYQLTDLDVNGS